MIKRLHSLIFAEVIMAERTKILDVYERRAFRTIYEAINWCVGTNYTYWGRACWPSVNPTDGFRMWFTQLAYVEHGRFVPAVNNCLNLLCCNGNYHVFDKIGPIEPDDRSRHKWKYDLIFSKEVGGYYYFRGVFIGDYEHSAPNHHVSKRIATKVKLIGCPARRLELLDSVPEVEFDEDYLKKHIKSSDVIDVGPSILSPSTPRVKNENKSITTPKKVVQAPTIDYAKMFPSGCRVKHKAFGIGIVKNVHKAIVTVDFKDVGLKELGADVCVMMNLLEKL